MGNPPRQNINDEFYRRNILNFQKMNAVPLGVGLGFKPSGMSMKANYIAPASSTGSPVKSPRDRSRREGEPPVDPIPGTVVAKCDFKTIRPVVNLGMSTIMGISSCFLFVTCFVRAQKETAKPK